MIAGRRIPVPTRYTLLSGVGTALVLFTVPLSFTFEGVSIPFIQLLMRGDILLIAPIVDLMFGRKVRWWSWTALVMVLVALVITLTDRGGLHLPPLAILTVVLYTIGYFVRLAVMTKVSKSGDPASVRRYFVEEKVFALPLSVAILAAISAAGFGNQAGELAWGFVSVWTDPVILAAVRHRLHADHRFGLRAHHPARPARERLLRAAGARGEPGRRRRRRADPRLDLGAAAPASGRAGRRRHTDRRHRPAVARTALVAPGDPGAGGNNLINIIIRTASTSGRMHFGEDNLMTYRRTLLSRTAIGAVALLLASPALAQTTEPVTEESVEEAAPVDPAEPAADATADPSADLDTNQGEDIIVTGSRIRGIDPVGSNVIAIGQEEIATTPVISVNDLLRRVPQVAALGANRQGGTAQNSAANATRGAGINLRGLGIGATLLLYDGKRFPPQGTQGQYTDPSVLPSITLSRVEVVADGASAIYGSDAIAGVVNFILRKNFDGIEIRARSGVTTEGSYNEQQLAGIVGKRWEGGSAMLSAEYTRNSELTGRELDFYQDDNRFRGGRDLRLTFCNPGTITAGGGTYAIPVGGVTSANVGSLVRGTTNRCFNNRIDAVIPEQERYNVVGAISQDVAEGIRLFADGFYSYREGTLPRFDNITATVRNTNPFFVTPVPGLTQVVVNYSLIPEIGPVYNPYHGDSWNVSAGVEADLFGDWTGTFYYSHGESEDVADRRLALNGGALTAALNDTNPATALNVFGGPNNPATIARVIDSLFVITGRTRLDVANLQVDGSLFDLPGGAVRVAVGGEYRKEYTFTDLLTGSSTNQTSVADSGSRTVKALFGEMFVPIVGSANAVPGIEQLSVSVAGRYEKYSDFGDTANPKIGFTYKPIDQVTLRGSYGTSFRAPTFVEVSTIAGGAGLYYDTLPGPTGNIPGIGIAGGNPDLEPETATTWSVGAEARPLEGLMATLTYFDIDYTNQIQALRGTAGLLTNPLYSSFVKFNPTPAEVQALINSGLPINNALLNTTPLPPVLFIADGRRQNLGTTLVNGIDFGIYYEREFGEVTVDTGFQGTYYTKYDFEAVPNAGLTDVLGRINFPQKFRSQADIGVKWREFSTRLTWNHLSGYLNNTITPAQDVTNYDTFDLYLGWDLDDRFRFSVDVRNLFNEDPPFVDIPRGYDPQSTNPVPRLISFTAGLKF